MLFNSLPFLFAFLPVTLWVYWRVAVRRDAWRLWWLTLTSYAFYAVWNYRFLPLIIGSTVVDHVVGPRIYRAATDRTRRQWLMVSIIANLGALAYFKYYNFAAVTINVLGRELSLPDLLPVLNVALPIGISFTAFESLSYTIDLYRRQTQPAPNFVTLAAFVSVFPRMIAGPIIRFANFAPQLALDPRRRDRASDLLWGMHFFVWGLAKKVLIADSLGEHVDMWLSGSRHAHLGFAGTWLVTLGFSYQLYFDFSGYSDMAVGLGRWLGFDLPQNFRRPYRAQSLTDFWRRWHITLSAWLRDYLYVPLGGSRFGSYRTLRNVMVTMMLGGLWHGANWTFVIWGTYHGVLLVGERYFSGTNRERSSEHVGARPIRAALTFALVVVGWSIFRSPNLTVAAHLLTAMVGGHGAGASFIAAGTMPFIAMIVAAGLLAHAAPDTWDVQPIARWPRVMWLGVLAAICVLWMTKASPFLYFQF